MASGPVPAARPRHAKITARSAISRLDITKPLPRALPAWRRMIIMKCRDAWNVTFAPVTVKSGFVANPSSVTTRSEGGWVRAEAVADPGGPDYNANSGLCGSFGYECIRSG